MHGVKVEMLCPICYKKEEISLHALWRYSSLKSRGSGRGISGDEVFIQDFQAANKLDGGPSSQRMPSKWLVPPIGVYKINTDADRDKVSWIGVMIRDWNGHVTASLCQNVRASLQPQVVEAMAILRGLQLAIFETAVY
ncbi:hypothetical protein Ddye_004629 [Dipteronia dyeriana]|uniref:RNase H type-1 domain-containing protein n=1 Tax=Dipteronia dyeriana TaxID=168575 RepID=A0AAE0CWH9_9ROSI|nr:hypothetical protein Ddye_004629 [Dipteronia dyeriana]